MGKTYNNQTRRFEDENSSQRSGKHSKHANGKKTGGMKTLNSYVEYDYDEDFDEDFTDLYETKHTNTN